jgi:hypothetical protein
MKHIADLSAFSLVPLFVLTCASATRSFKQNGLFQDIDYCHALGRKDRKPFDTFHSQAHTVDTSVRFDWEGGRVWTYFILPVFGLITDSFRDTIHFSFVNRRSNDILLNKCDIQFFASQNEKDQTQPLDVLPDCQKVQSTVIKSGAFQEFTSNYPKIGDIRQVRIRFFDFQTNREFHQVINVNDDWVFCVSTMN